MFLYIQDCLLELRGWHCHEIFIVNNLICHEIFIVNNLILEERKESKQNNHEILLEFDNTNVKGICQFIMNFEEVYM
jgi:hypothetical protein